MAVTLTAVVIALMHGSGLVNLGFLQQLDDILYDVRLRATLSGTLDDRIVIVDLDEKSLAEVGRWPWGRQRVAQLMDELFDRQNVAAVGFDVVFAEPDDSSGLKRLRQLAESDLKDQPAFVERLKRLESGLDYDKIFAQSLKGRPAVMGYYFSNDGQGRTSGRLPEPVLKAESLRGQPVRVTSWSGFGANIESVAAAAPVAGYFNPIVDADGVVRAVPLVAEYRGRYYEALSLAMFRTVLGFPPVSPVFPADPQKGQYRVLEALRLGQPDNSMLLPVSDGISMLIPYRGPGGPDGGSFRYVSAVDVMEKRVPAGALQGRIVLIGTTAPGLKDLRVTPVGEAYPGVETHANLISGMLDGRVLVRPDYSIGYDVVQLVAAGLLLALALPVLSAAWALALCFGVIALIMGLNLWFYLGVGLVLPLAGAVFMVFTAFALNMSWGYFVESRSKRELANLFGTYVPPELVDEMVRDPDSYSMTATNKELTVMFCDMRGFTRMSEEMEPIQLQALLNAVFTRLTDLIRGNRGTIDKYMGDCVMAFWGAPVDTPDHAHLAVKTALEMAQAVRQLNEEHAAAGLPVIGIGIGLNTGLMCVGDMGSDVRRAYTVIGDAVNLGSRLEGLSKAYGVEIVVSESTRRIAPEYAWQDLDKVRVKGKEKAVGIFQPLAPGRAEGDLAEELNVWGLFLKAYRAQAWETCELQMLNLQRMNPHRYLYQLYAARVVSMREQPFDPDWDGATNFETK